MPKFITKKFFFVFVSLCVMLSIIYGFYEKNFYHEIQIILSNDRNATQNELQLFFILNRKNDDFSEKFSLSKKVKFTSKESTEVNFTLESLRLKNRIKALRLDLGNEKDIEYTIHAFLVNGENFLDSNFQLHDAVIESKNKEQITIRTMGSDPYLYVIVTDEIKPKFNFICLFYIFTYFVLTPFLSGLIYCYVLRKISIRYIFVSLPILTYFIICSITNNYQLLGLFTLELMFFIVAIDSLYNHSVWIKRLLFVFVSLIFGIQAASIANTGDLLIVLTLENIGEYKDVGPKVVRLSFAIVMFFVIFSFLFPKNKIFEIRKFQRLIILTILLVLIVLLNYFNIRSPFFNAINTFLNYAQFQMISSDLGEKEKQKIIYGKDIIVNDVSIDDAYRLDGKNIIVIFTEGFSANLLGINNGIKDLTPNIDKLVSKSLNLENYYNHTAATFRGIRGQLTSSYQLVGGYTNDNSGIGELSEQELKERYSDTVIGIPQILRENNYHSYFVVSHKTNHNLVYMLKTLFFDNVFGSNDYKKLHEDRELTDQELFDFVNELIESKTLQEPYILGVYNEGTHLGLDSPDVKYKNGENILLNTVANYDNAVSKLINRFYDDKYASNNVLIITADHATFPSTLYKQTIDGNALYFVNKVPFIVYTYGIKPNVIDVHGMNSLSFAPTILHMLGITNGQNYFLGCSVFDKKCKSEFKCVTNIGSEIYKTDNAEIKRSEDKLLEIKIKKFYNLSN